jgi:hypothetical protein
VDVKQLQLTQEDMMKKLSDEPMIVVTNSEPVEPNAQRQKKYDGMSRKIGWKGWSWKQSPVKTSSIEEENLLDSPRKSQYSSKSSTPNQSPKHRNNSSETIKHCTTPESTSSILRRKQNKSDAMKTELRSSASARLLQLFDSKEGINKLECEYDEFRSLLPDNTRPASIHVLQTIKSDDF